MSRKSKDNLTREVLEQLIGDPLDDGMPVILAKRLDPQIPTTSNLRDYGFEGLTRLDREGGVQWEPSRNFVLTIDGDTGDCRIPETEFNRKRLKRLSVPRTEKAKVIIVNDDGKSVESEQNIQVPATYMMMEQSLAKSALVDSVAKRVMEMMKGEGKEAAPSKSKGGHQDDNLLEPIR